MTTPQTKSGAKFLHAIVSSTHERVRKLCTETSFEGLLEASRVHSRRSFAAALTLGGPAIIAEVKKASPSKGLLRRNLEPAKLAMEYERGGAAAVSVVTEPEFFQGDDAWVALIREVVGLPILRKDFVIDPIQVAETAALGSDAVLLIARLLDANQLRELSAASKQAGLDVLYEAHDMDDLTKILSCQPRMVGINARNLDDFSVDINQLERLRAHILAGVITVAESGIESHTQVSFLHGLGYNAFLVGERLVRSMNPAADLRMFRDGSGAV